LRDLSFTVDALNQEMKRLKGGPFVKEMVEHFDSVADKTISPPNRKVFMYSGHDTTVAPVLHSLGVFNMIAPPYASMVVVELLDRQGLVVRVSYKNDSSEQPHLLTIPGCTQLCPLNKFKGRYEQQQQEATHSHICDRPYCKHQARRLEG
jgi:hypothetical protein